ncbi:hypothetical protein [Halodesulfovibrio aestuarii]
MLRAISMGTPAACVISYESFRAQAACCAKAIIVTAKGVALQVADDL